ncbi:MAG: DNA polymerase III subunit beta [Deltaproteobacteria bacterium]|nr:DNA polymerase III subunit beta [Deltaproteobacteria bacterium]
MELRISVTELARTVSLAQGVVQRKNTMPILSHVLLDAQVDDAGNGRLQLTATDLDVGVKASRPCEVVTPGAVTIPAKALADMVRVLPGPDVVLKRLPNQHVEVKSGRTKARLMALSADEFPTLPAYESAHFVPMDKALLVDMVDKTLYAASLDETRPNLNGVFFEPPAQPDGPLTMVATDGHRLVRVERTFAGAHTFRLKGPVILPRKGLNELKRVLDGSDGDNAVELGFHGDNAVARKGNTLLGMRLVEGRFPDYRQVIPRLADKVVRLSRQDLMESLRRVSVLAQDKLQAVKVTLGRDQLVVSCTNVEMGEISDDVPVEYAGAGLDVAFNARYLVDALASLDDKNVLLKVTDNLSPGLLVGVDEPRHLCVVMPMRL